MLPAPTTRPETSPKQGPIYKVPIEILFKIFRLLAPPRTRDGIYILSELTHVCRFWRVALINKPQVWATIFATQADRRSFVEMCLERSYPAPLDVTVDARYSGPEHASCVCDWDKRSRRLPSEVDPCKWHFVFEPLAEKRHSERIHALEILLDDTLRTSENRVPLALEGCRFFDLPSLPLTSLKWIDKNTQYANYLFSVSPFLPTLRSISFRGSCYDQLTKLSNLTSFTLKEPCLGISAEMFRTFMLNNQSLEMLSLDYVEFEGGSNGPPAHLPNLKSFNVYFSEVNLSTLFRIPALQGLSFLLISTDEDRGCWDYTYRATGEGIEFAFKGSPPVIAKAWRDITGYVNPTIKHIRLENPDEVRLDEDEDPAVALFADGVHTLEIGSGYLTQLSSDFLRSLEQLGPQLKTIRFEIPEETEPFGGPIHEHGWGSDLLDNIVDLVVYRFEHGRPLSSVERMVVSESERINRQQSFVWRSFYDDRSLYQHVQN